jgi:site-specific recombinase XerD
MNELAVVDRQTQTLLTMPIYVADENTPARTEGNALTPRLAQRGMRALQLANASRDFQLAALASDAAEALRDWRSHNEERLRAGLSPDQETVRGFIRRVVDAEADLDGITAWLILDSDKPPSDRTISEYQGTVRDVLLWLAEQGLCPATASRADTRAYVAWMQVTGAPVQMEVLRARWYGYEPRVQYLNDWRGWAALAGKRLYAEAVRDAIEAVTNAAHDKKSKLAARQAKQAVERCRGCLALILVLVRSYENMPRRTRFERYSSETISLRITLTRSFWKAALKRQAVFENPLSDVKVVKSETNRRDQVLNRRFSDDEVAALLADCAEERCRSPYERAKAARDKALIALPAVLGLRVSEVNELDVSDYNRSEGEFGTLYIRGDRDRAMALTEKTQAVLDSHLAYRTLLNPATPAMFVTMNHGARIDGAQPGERISTRAIRDMFDERQRALNMKRPGRSVHGLRHRFATKAIRSGGNLCTISTTLGHSQLTTTQVYVEVAAFEDENVAKLTDNVL